MAKIIINNATGISSINSNFDKVESEFNNKVLYRDNPDGEPNEMLNNLDMNEFRILNLPVPLSPSEPARIQDVLDNVVTYPSIYDEGVLKSPAAKTINFVGAEVTAGAVGFDATVTITSDAATTVNTPSGNISATNVQAAINELDTEKVSLAALSATNGSSLVGFQQLGTGAVLRTSQAKGLEFITLKDFGAVGDGATDDTLAVQSFLTAAAGRRGFINAGTYIITSVTVPSNTTLEGEGFNVSVFKRKNSAVGNSSLFDIAGATGISIKGIGFDGNKANQTNASTSVTIGNCDDITITECAFINAKAVGGGFGGGLAIVTGSGQTNNRKITIRNNQFSNNDAVDLYVNRTWYVDISDNYMKGSGGGINVMNYVFPPVADVQNFISITNNTIRNQTGTGITFFGYVDSGTSAANEKAGPNVPPQRHCVITGNKVASCSLYGIAFQGANSIISDNTVHLCGARGVGGGILMNGYGAILDGNTVRDCYSYGIDAGACYSSSITNNNLFWNGTTDNAPATDINCGGAFSVIVSGNVIEQAGTHQMVAIGAKGIESDGIAPFPISVANALGLTISNNRMILNSNVNTIGVWVYNCQERILMFGNNVRMAQQNRAYIIEAVGIVSYGNVDEFAYSSGTPVMNVASAATMIIPDVGEKFVVTGTAGITSLRSYSENIFSGKIRTCTAPAHGSGYSRSTPPTVTFSGGGGTGLAVSAEVSYNGEVVQWAVTNPGSGYTSAPTPSITHNGGSGATCSPQLGCDNNMGREITLSVHWCADRNKRRQSGTQW